ncbi:hypothetical protein PR048_008528 [Dryococelus australis]|uniref:Uncharacterized protein n=1 Tax=Dryococelus australis TaxID=614101 RepID=A0ABQ9HXD8_9NEOP|nr:hypothetical protein PR048_008528 [Dryococelus australis]
MDKCSLFECDIVKIVRERAKTICSAGAALGGHVKGLLYLELYSAFEAEKRGSDKDHSITCIKCAIDTKRKVLNWRAMFSSYCVYLCDFQRYHAVNGDKFNYSSTNIRSTLIDSLRNYCSGNGGRSEKLLSWLPGLMPFVSVVGTDAILALEHAYFKDLSFDRSELSFNADWDRFHGEQDFTIPRNSGCLVAEHLLTAFVDECLPAAGEYVHPGVVVAPNNISEQSYKNDPTEKLKNKALVAETVVNFCKSHGPSRMFYHDSRIRKSGRASNAYQGLWDVLLPNTRRTKSPSRNVREFQVEATVCEQARTVEQVFAEPRPTCGVKNSGSWQRRRRGGELGTTSTGPVTPSQDCKADSSSRHKAPLGERVLARAGRFTSGDFFYERAGKNIPLPGRVGRRCHPRIDENVVGGKGRREGRGHNWVADGGWKCATLDVCYLPTPPKGFCSLGLLVLWSRTYFPPRRTGLDSRRGSRAGRCRWSAGFLRDLPFYPPFHSGAAAYSPRFTLIGSQDHDQKIPLGLLPRNRTTYGTLCNSSYLTQNPDLNLETSLQDELDQVTEPEDDALEQEEQYYVGHARHISTCGGSGAVSSIETSFPASTIRNSDILSDASTSSRRRASRLPNKSDDLENAVTKYFPIKSNLTENNPDWEFFKSILPDIAHITPAMKRQFKRKSVLVWGKYIMGEKVDLRHSFSSMPEGTDRSLTPRLLAFWQDLYLPNSVVYSLLLSSVRVYFPTKSTIVPATNNSKNRCRVWVG